MGLDSTSTVKPLSRTGAASNSFVVLMLLIAATETLDGFAAVLSQISENAADLDLPAASNRKGRLSLPVSGEILRRAGETDAAGVTRPGILIATRPRALVTTPAAATRRIAVAVLEFMMDIPFASDSK